MAQTGGTVAPRATGGTGGTAAPRAAAPVRIPGAGAAPQAKVPRASAQPTSSSVHRAAAVAKSIGKTQKAKGVAQPKQHTTSTRSSSRTTSTKTTTQKPSKTTTQKPFLQQSPAEIQKTAKTEVEQNTKAELQPFEARAKEITGIEGTVANRYNAYGNATNTLLGNLQSSSEAGAKTSENEAAESAIKAQSAVGATGANSTTILGGENPQMKAQQLAERSNTAESGQARQAGAAAMGQNEQNYVTNIRAAAAQRISEGEKNIASVYGTERAKNQGEIDKYLAKESGATTKLDSELLQKQFTDQATNAGLGIKTQTANAATENAKTKTQTLKVTAANDEAKNKLAAAKLSQTERYQDASVAQKETLDAAKIKESAAKTQDYLSKSKSALTPTEQAKYATELGAAYLGFVHGREGAGSKNAKVAKGALSNKEIRENLTRGKEVNRERPTPKEAEEGKKGKVIKETYQRVQNQALISAAQEIYDYHAVSAATRSALGRLGITLPTQSSELLALVGQ